MAELLSKAEVARIYHVTRGAVGKACARGHLIVTLVNGRERIDPDHPENLRWLSRPSRPRHRGPGMTTTTTAPKPSIRRAGGRLERSRERYALLAGRHHAAAAEYVPAEFVAYIVAAFLDHLSEELRRLPSRFPAKEADPRRWFETAFSGAILEAKAGAKRLIGEVLAAAEESDGAEEEPTLPEEAPRGAGLAEIRDLTDSLFAARHRLARRIEAGELISTAESDRWFGDLGQAVKFLTLEALPPRVAGEMAAILSTKGAAAARAWISREIEDAIERLEPWRERSYARKHIYASSGGGGPRGNGQADHGRRQAADAAARP